MIALGIKIYLLTLSQSSSILIPVKYSNFAPI